MKILGICGTPLKGKTNTGYLAEMIMDACREQADGVETEIIRLADKKIAGGCNHCNWCLKKQTREKICAQRDDWSEEIAHRIVESDALVWATPVYLMRMSWLMTSYIDRHRAFLEGRHYGIRGPEKNGVHKNKPVLAAAVAWDNHGGIETTQQVLCQTAICLGMIPVAGFLSLGVPGVSAAPPGELGAVRKDRDAIRGAKLGAKRLVEFTAMMKSFKAAS